MGADHAREVEEDASRRAAAAQGRGRDDAETVRCIAEEEIEEEEEEEEEETEKEVLILSPWDPVMLQVKEDEAEATSELQKLQDGAVTNKRLEGSRDRAGAMKPRALTDLQLWLSRKRWQPLGQRRASGGQRVGGEDAQLLCSRSACQPAAAVLSCQCASLSHSQSAAAVGRIRGCARCASLASGQIQHGNLRN
jgi:hypothetical protein